jgi:hypothetical protein
MHVRPAARDLARAMDLPWIELTVWLFNRRAIDFFAAQGFSPDYQHMSMKIKEEG